MEFVDHSSSLPRRPILGSKHSAWPCGSALALAGQAPLHPLRPATLAAPAADTPKSGPFCAHGTRLAGAGKGRHEPAPRLAHAAPTIRRDAYSPTVVV
jgi:hypothetical protein